VIRTGNDAILFLCWRVTCHAENHRADATAVGIAAANSKFGFPGTPHAPGEGRRMLVAAWPWRPIGSVAWVFQEIGTNHR
jgi:hypothetical protein